MGRIYHRDQPGAPALIYSSVSQGPAHYQAMFTVLKACLVTGYPGRPAAGWKLIAEGLNYLVLRSGNDSFYLCLTHLGSGTLAFYLSETYTGMDGNIMVGDGLKSGVATGSTVQHVGICRRLAHSDANSSWALAADEKSFCLGATGNLSNDVLSDIPGTDSLLLYVGEDLDGLPIALGGVAGASASKLSFFSAQGGVTVLKSPRTGLLIGSSAVSVSTPSLYSTATLTSFSSACPLEQVTLGSPVWFADGAFGGRLRGLAQVFELSKAYSLNAFAKSLGRSTNLTIRDLSTPIDLADGFTYLLLPVSGGDCILLTDNPEFWP